MAGSDGDSSIKAPLHIENNLSCESSIYILPGNVTEEAYRKATFKDFPNDVPVHCPGMLSSGFFYTGYKDRVQCFRCGETKENWKAEDDPRDHRWHKDDCEFQHSSNAKNVAASVSPNLELAQPDMLSSDPLPVIPDSRFYPDPDLKRSSNKVSSKPKSFSVSVKETSTFDINDWLEGQMTSSWLFVEASTMGFECRLIKRAFKKQYEKYGRVFSCLEDFVDFLLELEKSHDEKNETFTPASRIGQEELNESQQFRDDLQCKICNKKMISIVFYPCAHVVCCTLCGLKREKCPICDDVIQERRCCHLYFQST